MVDTSQGCMVATDREADARSERDRAQAVLDRAEAAVKSDLHRDKQVLSGFAACAGIAILRYGSKGPAAVGGGVTLCGTAAAGALWTLNDQTGNDIEARDRARAERDRAQKAFEDAHSDKFDACVNPGGCGSRGGPGWRRPDGKCASYSDDPTG